MNCVPIGGIGGNWYMVGRRVTGGVGLGMGGGVGAAVEG